jgi:S1-C subfamily serine protease
VSLRRLNNRAALLALALVSAFAPPPATDARTAGPPSRLVEHVKRAVVVVNSYDERGRLLSQGSGFFVRQTQITTNLHVVGAAARVEVVTFGGRVCAVEGVVALDGRRDLALLQLGGAAEGVRPLAFVESAPPAGEEVFVVSNPRGSLWEVSRGTTLAPREFPELGPLVPFTAAVARGSSGGPVVDLRGRVVGVATMGLLRASGEDFFAVPAEHAARLRPRALMPFPLRNGD